MKTFFDGFDWEMAIEFVLFAVAIALLLIAIIWAISIDSLWPFLLRGGLESAFCCFSVERLVGRR